MGKAWRHMAHSCLSKEFSDHGWQLGKEAAAFQSLQEQKFLPDVQTLEFTLRSKVIWICNGKNDP